MKSLSNLIFKTKSNGIIFDKDFILKRMPKKMSVSGESDLIYFYFFPGLSYLIFVVCLLFLVSYYSFSFSLSPINSFIHIYLCIYWEKQISLPYVKPLYREWTENLNEEDVSSDDAEEERHENGKILKTAFFVPGVGFRFMSFVCLSYCIVCICMSV